MKETELNNLYIPVLKWKKGEHVALFNLHPDIKSRVYPCIEIRTEKQHSRLVSKLSEVWEGSALVDYASPEGLLEGWRGGRYSTVLGKILLGDLNLTPVINPFDHTSLSDPLIVEQLQKCQKVCLRVRLRDFPTANDVSDACVNILTAIQNSGKAIEMIFDFGETPEELSNELVSYIVDLTTALDNLNFIQVFLVSGAYPTALKAGVHRIPRSDRELWKAVSSKAKNLNLGYGDYTVVPATWEEVEGMQRGTIAIRYALEKEWLILKGRSNKKEESIQLSEILVNLYSTDFKGAPYSYGDKLISDKADATVPMNNKKGGTTYQIIEGINHHITLVVNES